MGVLRILGYFAVFLGLNVAFQNCAKKPATNDGESASSQAIMNSKAAELLQQKCAACHSGAAAYANAVPGHDPILDIADVEYLLRTRLVVPGEPDLSPLFQVIQRGEMPPGQPLVLNEIDMLKFWIEELNEVPTSGNGGGLVTVPLAPNFTSLRVNVFLPKCFSCHSQRAVRLDTHASVAAAIANQNLRNRVVSTGGNRMPPINAAQLTDQERTFLLQWIDAGAPNN